MRRIFQLSVLCLAASVVNACKPDEIIETENIPTAGVRFINAVPDTGAMDFRFVDIPENNTHWNQAFRNNPQVSGGVTASTGVQYKPARVPADGQRRFKIFMNGATAAVASDEVIDTTVTLTAGRRYTALMWGRARGGANPMRLTFFEDTVLPPFDPATQIGLRVINASTAAVDATYYPATGAPPGTTIAANIAALSMTAFVTAAPASLRFNVRPAGGGTFVLADALALAGSPPTISGATCDPVTQKCDLEGFPGTTQAGSAVTLILFDPPVTGSQAPTFTITTGASAVLLATPTGYGRTAGSFAGDGFFVGQQVSASGYINAANNGTSVITAISEPTTGSTSLSATATGYARAAGSFLTNGFAVGQRVTASGFTNAVNNGRSVITAVTATSMTVTKAGGTVAEAAATGRTVAGDPTITVTKTGGTVNEAGSTGTTTILSATATGYRRSAGDFVAEGFTVGQSVTASGFIAAANNGASTVSAVTATDLTVTKTGGTVVEAGSTGATALSATTTGYARAAGSFITDGFMVGQRVNGAGFFDSANNGASTVTAVTATALTVTKTPQTVAEVACAACSVTNIDSRTIANNTNHTIAGVNGRLWTFIWDRRPPRPPGT